MGFSKRQVKRKVCPSLRRDSGMRFPLGPPLGKHVPLYGSIPGRSFRLRRHPETTSQSERGFRDGLSAWAAIGKACPGLRCQDVFFTPAPCTEFDSPRYGLEIKRQVDTNIYLPVTYGGGAENRTPVHESPLIGISKLSRWFSLGRFARSDTLAAS